MPPRTRGRILYSFEKSGWCRLSFVFLFFFNDTATTEIYTLSLHDALPIWRISLPRCTRRCQPMRRCPRADRKSTRLNSSHTVISYAVFCLKKKKKIKNRIRLLQQAINNQANNEHCSTP